MSVLVLVLTIGVGNAWGDETITEDFENTNQEIQMNNNNAYYQGSVTYDAEDSNAEIGWSVEHGTVSTDAALNGSRSLQMRAYYSKNSATSAWNGNLPYLQSTTAVTGLKSISFNAKVSSTTNQNLLVNILYSTNGSSWSAMKTNAQTPANATSIAYTTTSTEYTYNIPSSDPTTDYYIKIAVSSSSTHTTNAQKASGSGNIKLIIDNIVFTYTSASCTATPSIGDASLNGSFSLSSVGVSCASSGAGANCSITKYGWVWSDGTSSTNPLIDGTGVTKHETSGAPSGTNGAFTGTLSGSFTVGHTYYYKAYVTNGKPATAYSAVQSFTPRQITFYKNDGTSTTSTQIVKNGVATNLTANSFTRTGHTFNGWNTQADGKGTDKANQASVTVSGGNLDLYAKWSKNSYTLTWNLNGGTVTVAGTGAAVDATGTPNSSVPYGDAITAPTVVKTGYTQNGWNSTPASTMPAGNTTYTAQWTANKYDITYKDQGGGDFTGIQTSAPAQHTYGSNTTLKIPTKTGYTFGGWFTASDCTSGAVGNTNSASLGATDYTDNIILYAKWTKNNYTLTWNLNGGTVTEAGTGAAVDATGSPSSSVPFDDEITAPTVTKYGYNFSSWNTTPANKMPASNTTYTAAWTAKSFTVTWNVNGTVYSAGGSTSVNFNGHVSTLPTDPDPKDYCGKKFMGWTTVENVKQNDDTGLGLFTTAGTAPTVTVEGDVIYYAVFADYAN